MIFIFYIITIAIMAIFCIITFFMFKEVKYKNFELLSKLEIKEAFVTDLKIIARSNENLYITEVKRFNALLDFYSTHYRHNKSDVLKQIDKNILN